MGFVQTRLDKDYPEASVVCAALLHQSSKTADDVLRELQNLKKGHPSSFKDSDWVHHFLVGSILLVYFPYRQRACPLYAGFSAFRSLSKTNVRHFVELCNLATTGLGTASEFADFSVSIDAQAEAALKVSRLFKNEVAGCGDFGNRLLAIVNVMGKLYLTSNLSAVR